VPDEKAVRPLLDESLGPIFPAFLPRIKFAVTFSFRIAVEGVDLGNAAEGLGGYGLESRERQFVDENRIGERVKLDNGVRAENKVK